MFKSYNATGQRVPFDPAQKQADLAGCLLCGRRPIALLGLAMPNTPEAAAIFLRLRQHPLPARSTPGLAYGLCATHADDPDFDRIDATIWAAAARVRVQ